MADSTTIANFALGRLGQPAILSIDDATPTARICKLFYEQTRDAVLRSHRWNFAIQRKTLTQLSHAPEFGWTIQYQLPPDCLRMLALNDIDENDAQDRWEIEGRKLLTNEDVAQVRYISRVEDASQFDPLFTDALVVKLASKIAKPITGSSTLAQDALQEYEALTAPGARRADAFEARPTRRLPWVESDLVRSRQVGPLG